MNIKQLLNAIFCCINLSEQSTEQQKEKIILQVLPPENLSGSSHQFKEPSSIPKKLSKIISSNSINEQNISFGDKRDIGYSSGAVSTSPKNAPYKDDEDSSSSSIASDHSDKNGTYVSKSELNKVKIAVSEDETAKANIERDLIENYYSKDDLAQVIGDAQTFSDDDSWIV